MFHGSVNGLKKYVINGAGCYVRNAREIVQPQHMVWIHGTVEPGRSLARVAGVSHRGVKAARAADVAQFSVCNVGGSDAIAAREHGRGIFEMDPVRGFCTSLVVLQSTIPDIADLDLGNLAEAEHARIGLVEVCQC